MESISPPGFEFSDPSTLSKIAARELIDAVPSDVMVRGVFLNFILDELARAGQDEPRRIAFKMVPLAELMELEVRAAGVLHPQVPLREGLRRLGRLSYPSLVSTTAGRVLFSVAGVDFRVAITLASKAYGLSMTRGSCEIKAMHRGWARLLLKDNFNFVDATQVGVFEGAMDAYAVKGRVRVRPIDALQAELLLEWE